MPRIHDETEMNWVCVYSTTQLYKAEIIRGMLEEEGIQAVVVNKQDSSYIAFGEIELLVPREEVINAKQIMERAATHD